MALEIPFIHSLTADGDPSPVNFNDMFTFEKYDNNVITNIKVSKYAIIFYRDENSVGPKEIWWKYKHQCDRDSEYAKVLLLVSKPI